MLGFPSAYIGIYKNSKHIPEALELIDMLSADEVEAQWLEFFGTKTHMNVNTVIPGELTENNKRAQKLWEDGFISMGYITGNQLYEAMYNEFARVVLGELTIEEALANVEAWARENQDILPKS